MINNNEEGVPPRRWQVQRRPKAFILGVGRQHADAAAQWRGDLARVLQRLLRHWGVIRLASVLHAFFAFVLIASIVVHVYAAIWVKGSVAAMTSGKVSWAWARKHHKLWYDEMRKKER